MRPAIPAHIDPEVPLSVPQLAAAFDWLGERALREAIREHPEVGKGARVRSRSKPGAQRWARFLVPREFAEDCEHLPPCSAPGCNLPALTDNEACGQRGHGKAGQPRAPGDWSMVDKTAAAKAGKLSLVRAARELGVDRTVLRRRIDAGDIDAEKDANDWFLIDPAEIERVRGAFQCKEPGCRRVALGETGYCGTKGGGHAGAASRRGVNRPREERERISQTKQRKEQVVIRNLASMGKAPPSIAAPACEYSPHTFRGAALRDRDGVPRHGRPPVTHIEYVTENGVAVSRVASDVIEVGRWVESTYGPRAARSARSRLAWVRAAAHGTQYGRPPGTTLTNDELAMVIELRAADPKYWGYGRLAAKVNEERKPDKRISRMVVKHALEAAVSGIPPV